MRKKLFIELNKRVSDFYLFYGRGGVVKITRLCVERKSQSLLTHPYPFFVNHLSLLPADVPPQNYTEKCKQIPFRDIKSNNCQQ
jgi:hypothetical protein